MRLLQWALSILLLLLLRKLLWCLRWLWCWRRGRETPPPIAFLPLRTGRVFEEHVRQAGGERESQEQDSR
jgi:hypothetical protein